MVRTTETDGVKLLYNGELKQVIENEPITQDKYNVTTNTPTETPFTFDESTKKWTSGIAGVYNGKNTIEFTITEAGDYVLNYEVSSSNIDNGSFYKNEIGLKTDLNGILNGQIELNELATDDVIKVVYKRENSVGENDDAVRFSIGKPLGNVTTNCNNTGVDSSIDPNRTKFNTNFNSLAYVGYMYGTPYSYSSQFVSRSSDAIYYYGHDALWNGTTYTLSDTEKGTIFDIYSELGTKHYTCFSTSSSCSTVYYIFNMGSQTSATYYITLSNGKKIENALDEMLNYNTTNSNIKTVIDNWYSTNMTNVTNYLENAIYCNNRHIYDLGSWEPSGEVNYDNFLKFNDYSYSNARLTCQDKEDQFTLKVDFGGTLGYGNNALDYPIGLLTAKEAILALGETSDNYLNNYYFYYLMSPNSFYNYSSEGRLNYVDRARVFYDATLGSSLWIRPAITLKQNILITGGTGEIEDPYTVALPD